METEVTCWKYGTKLKIRGRGQSPASMCTEEYIEKLVVEPCPKCIKEAGMDVVKWIHCVKHGR